MKSLVIYGEASAKEIKRIDVTYSDFATDLMHFLIKNNIPIASSCGGEGLCQKCIVTFNYQTILSCQITIRDLLRDSDEQTLSLSYL